MQPTMLATLSPASAVFDTTVSERACHLSVAKLAMRRERCLERKFQMAPIVSPPPRKVRSGRPSSPPGLCLGVTVVFSPSFTCPDSPVAHFLHATHPQQSRFVPSLRASSSSRSASFTRLHNELVPIRGVSSASSETSSTSRPVAQHTLGSQHPRVVRTQHPLCLSHSRPCRVSTPLVRSCHPVAREFLAARLVLLCFQCRLRDILASIEDPDEVGIVDTTRGLRWYVVDHVPPWRDDLRSTDFTPEEHVNSLWALPQWCLPCVTRHRVHPLTRSVH